MGQQLLVQKEYCGKLVFFSKNMLTKQNRVKHHNYITILPDIDDGNPNPYFHLGILMKSTRFYISDM